MEATPRSRAGAGSELRVRPFEWALLVALLGALLGSRSGCAEPPGSATDADLEARFESIHRRVYDAYAIGPDRDRLWELLAGTFTGEALTREYVEHYTTLSRMQQEHTAIAVLQIDYDRIEVGRDQQRIVVDADWSVGGVVTHQDHRHPRINRYSATYSLAAPGGDGDELRIVDTTLRALERVTTSRGAGFPLDELPGSARGSLSLGDLLRSGALPQEQRPNRPPPSQSKPWTPPSPSPPPDDGL